MVEEVAKRMAAAQKSKDNIAAESKHETNSITKKARTIKTENNSPKEKRKKPKTSGRAQEREEETGNEREKDATLHKKHKQFVIFQ